MKIIKLEVEGYRSFKYQTWCPGDLNVVIGPNASGKSNLLRVAEMLSAAGQGKLGTYVQREGGMESVVWDGRSEQVRLCASMTPIPPYADLAEDALAYDLMLQRIGKSSSYRIKREGGAGDTAVSRRGALGTQLFLGGGAGETAVSRGVRLDVRRWGR